MNELDGIYFDGISARGQTVRVSSDGAQLRLVGAAIDIAVPIAQIKMSPRLGRTRRQITFADGAVCELDDNALLDGWFRDSSHRHANLLARLEAHWGAALTAFALVVVLAGALALWGLPWIAQRVAAQVPQAWVSALGRGTLTALDETLGSESKLPLPRRQQLRQQFSALAAAAAVDARFEFRAWPKLGANAFALPDGTIVMTDALVALATDDRELLAVVAHELGHVHERHALQQVIAGSGVAALVFVLTGDVSGLSHIVVAAPTILTQLHHSRALENAADQFGFALLARQHVDPMWFARIIRKLETAYREKNADAKTADAASRSWLQTHPASEQRAQLAEKYLQH